MAGSTKTLTANTAYFVPFKVASSQTALKIGMWYSGLDSAGIHIKMAIYTDTAVASVPGPSARLLNGSQQTTGAGAGNITQTISVALGPNALYWLAVVTDTNVTSLGIPIASAGVIPLAIGTGNLNVAPFTYITNTSMTYASAWPDPWSGALTQVSAIVPIIGLQF